MHEKGLDSAAACPLFAAQAQADKTINSSLDGQRRDARKIAHRQEEQGLLGMKIRTFAWLVSTLPPQPSHGIRLAELVDEALPEKSTHDAPPTKRRKPTR
ncbi:hypothetical protein [Hydrogenophaga sp. BPS33]|uniref:hypothetical protein n=1 Tax=Hydrogenophaga sp. BPS33 TaxID=2651974 RepID=UPI00132001AC|nr:hypothetical protein [Hydrogenophaga sp. BPS33]QHE85317.1 hypothetical protein F9K07_10630 [Hydrogenophaga sp. BPS33]